MGNDNRNAYHPSWNIIRGSNLDYTGVTSTTIGIMQALDVYIAGFVNNFAYQDDSNQFTVATSYGIAMMGMQTTDVIDNGDIGIIGINNDRSIKIGGSEGFVFGQDPYTLYGANARAIVQIDYEHYRLHYGHHFFATDLATIGAAGTKLWHLLAPNTVSRVHLTVKVKSSNSGIFEVYENPTLNVLGTLITPLNNDRNSATAAATVVREDTTYAVIGTLIYTEVMGTNAAAPSGDIGGFYERNIELILKQAEDYFFIFTADNASTRVSILFEWYET